jgi:deferrochelatase/peroxidase EfeB
MMAKEETEKGYNRIRDAIGLKALIEATSPEIGDIKNVSYEEESLDNTTVTAENEDGHSSDGFPAVLRDKREEEVVPNKGGPAPQEIAEKGVSDKEAVANTDGAVALPGMEKVIPDKEDNEDSSSPSVRKLIAKFSASPPQIQEKEEEEDEYDGFPAVLCDKKEAAVAVSVPRETAEESVPGASDESKDEKRDNEKVDAEMDGVASTVAKSEREEDGVTIVRRGVPLGPSYRSSAGDCGVSKPEEAAAIPQQTTVENAAISNGADCDYYVKHHDDNATNKDESTANISGSPPQIKEKEEEEDEYDGFPAVLCDKKEAAVAVSVPRETADDSVPGVSDESKDEKSDNEKVDADMDGVASTVAKSEQEEDDVTIVRRGVPLGPSYRSSAGDCGVSKPKEAAYIPQQTRVKDAAISNGADCDYYVTHHDDNATKNDESTANISGSLPEIQGKEEEEDEYDGFPSVLCDKKEDTVRAVAAISVPREIAEKSVPVESVESKDEKNHNEKVVDEMDGVPSTVTQREQENDDVTIIRRSVPFGPSHRSSAGDFGVSKPEEAASIPKQTTAKNTAISSGADCGVYVKHNDDKATNKDESTASIENEMGPDIFGIAAASGAIARSLSDTEDMKNTDVKLTTRSVDSPTSVDMANYTLNTNETTSNDINAASDRKTTTVGTDEMVASVPAPEKITAEEPVAAASPTSVDMASTEAPVEDVFKKDEEAYRLMLAVTSNEDFSRDLSSSKDDSGKCDYIGQSSNAAHFPLPDDAMSAASSLNNVVIVNTHASEQGLDLHSAQHGEKDLCYGESAEINEDSWTTQPDLEDWLGVLFASVTESKQKATSPDAPIDVSNLLGDRASSESNIYEPESAPRPYAPNRPESNGAPLSPKARHSTRPPSSVYKIGTAYFILRESDGIEYPVKILSLGKSGTTCIVAYEHHRAKKKVRTSSLLPDTPERRQKFQEQMNLGLVDSDLPARINMEAEQRRHEEHRHCGRYISRRNLPKCSTEGTLIKEPTRRVYFAIDRESVKDVAKKFNVPSKCIINDNKSAYPTLKKTSLLRPLTSLVLPP